VGFTAWTWALYSVRQGDDIILVASTKTYKLSGDREQLLKYIADKATVTGRLDGNVFEVSVGETAATKTETVMLH
jgi:hypothetical protein